MANGRVTLHTDYASGNMLTAGTVAGAADNFSGLNHITNEINRQALYDPPIGTVVSWLKSLDNTPALPDNWIECNGQVCDHGSSVYSGITIPNLNGSNSNTQRFLRG